MHACMCNNKIDLVARLARKRGVPRATPALIWCIKLSRQTLSPKSNQTRRWEVISACIKCLLAGIQKKMSATLSCTRIISHISMRAAIKHLADGLDGWTRSRRKNNHIIYNSAGRSMLRPGQCKIMLILLCRNFIAKLWFKWGTRHKLSIMKSILEFTWVDLNSKREEIISAQIRVHF